MARKSFNNIDIFAGIEAKNGHVVKWYLYFRNEEQKKSVK